MADAFLLCATALIFVAQMKSDLEKARNRERAAVHQRLQDVMLAYPVHMETYLSGPVDNARVSGGGNH